MKGRQPLQVSYQGKLVSVRTPEKEEWQAAMGRIDRCPLLTATKEDRSNALLHFMSLCALHGSDHVKMLYHLTDEELVAALDRMVTEVDSLKDYEVITGFVFFERPHEIDA